MLCKDLHVGDGTDWVFISDQQKGVLNAVEKWAPAAEHRNCARHTYANWKKMFRDKEYQKKFWACAKAPCVMLFNRARARLAKDTHAGAQAILNTHPQNWSRAWFRLGSNCDSVDNNLCESFNKWILEARLFPIITMLEIIRRKVLVRIHDNITKSGRWLTKICPNILKKCNHYITLSAKCHAICNGASKFEVQHFDNRFSVDLEKKECSCRYWQLSGLPCPYAISCIYFKTNSLEDYIAPCYSVEEFKKTYTYCLEPVEGMNSWPVSDRPKLKAPGYVRMPGRPKERRREATEAPKGSRMSKVGTIIRCSKCKQTGHNKSTCERHATTASATVGSHSIATVNVNPNAQSITTTTTTQSYAYASKKRKASAGPSTKATIKSSARASVSTGPGGNASVQLMVNAPRSSASASASATINITTGKATAKVSASAPNPKKSKPNPPRPGAMLLLPRASDKL